MKLKDNICESGPRFLRSNSWVRYPMGIRPRGMPESIADHVRTGSPDTEWWTLQCRLKSVSDTFATRHARQRRLNDFLASPSVGDI